MKVDEIRLSAVYDYLTNIVGNQSYILSDCIINVVNVKKGHKLENHINTLAIDSNGNLFVAEEFIEKYVEDEQALTVFLMHELFHAVLSDTKFMQAIDKADPEKQIKLLAANIAFDCRINAILSVLYNDNLRAAHVFTSLFENVQKNNEKEEPLNYLLYPGNGYKVGHTFGEEALDIYIAFYQEGDIKDFYRLYEIVLDYLRNNKNKYQSNSSVVFIGNHSDGEDSGENSEEKIEISSETAEAIGRVISEAIQESELKGELQKSSSKRAGIGDKIIETVVPLLERIETRTIPSDFLRKISISSITKNIKLAATKKIAKWTTSPVVPQKFAKSDVMRVMFDMEVLLWKHNKNISMYDPTLVPIYFDVSGSMTEFIPTVLDLILNIDGKINHIWCFSDYVSQHSLQELKDRKIRTSGGTNFDNVVKHIEENNFSAALVITDGEGYVSLEVPDCLSDVVTLLTPHGVKTNWFSNKFPDRTFDLIELVGNK